MQIVKTLGKIASKFLQRWLRKFLVLLDHLEKISSRAVLEDDPEVVARLVPIIELEDVAILQVVEDSNLKTDTEISNV